MKKLSGILFIILFQLFPYTCNATNDSLRTTIKNIAIFAQGNVSVSVQHIENGDTISYNGHHHCVMQSVFKFPIALAVLEKIDQNKFTLTSKICLRKKDMVDNTWSPMRDKYPNGKIKITIAELIKYMVSQSDNIACDILLKKIGGTTEVENMLRKHGIIDLEMPYNEAEMHQSWEMQYKNWCTPIAMTQLLTAFYKGNILSDNTTLFLKKTLEETSTGPTKIKGMLPNGTVVGHKTGTSGKNEDGKIAAVNDVGIITLPNGYHLAIAIFLNEIYADEKIQNFVIAGIAKAIYDNAILPK